MKENKISEISLTDGDDLNITYQNEGENITSYTTFKKSPNEEQTLKKIKDYLQNQGKQSISQAEIIKSQNSQQPNKTNYLPYILGGVGLVSLIGIVVYLIRKENK